MKSKTVSTLDTILADLADDAIRPDEFTAQQLYDKQRANGGRKTLESIRGLTKRMVNNGDLLFRKITINGKHTCVYRRAK